MEEETLLFPGTTSSISGRLVLKAANVKKGLEKSTEKH